jgi:hypothetical protein
MRTAFPPLALLLAGALVAAGCRSHISQVAVLEPPHDVGGDAFAPAIALDPARHDVFLAWVAGTPGHWRVWFARSMDRGGTWTVPIAVSPVGELVSTVAESPPRIVCDDEDHVGIAWATEAGAGNRSPNSSDLRFARSNDGGRTWGAPVTMNEDTSGTPGRQSYHDVQLRPEGAIYAAWLDSRRDSLEATPTADGDMTVWLARSDDFGEHWETNTAHWTSVCPNCRLSLVAAPNGDLAVAFRKHYPGGIRDVVLARAGGPPFRVREDAWQIDDCPPSGPAMTLSRDGTLRLAWYTGAATHPGVWFRQAVPELMDSTTAPVAVLTGRALPPVHVAIGDGGMSGTLFACDADSTGARALTLVRAESSGRRVVERFVVPATSGIAYPCIASERTLTFAFVAWTHQEGDHSRLGVARWEVGR